MSVLSDKSIKKLLDAGVVKNSGYEFINPASLDLRVGTTAKYQVTEATTHGWITKWIDVDLTACSEQQPHLIPYGTNLLVATQEIFYMPTYLAGFVNLKSSIARQFLQHMLAGFIDPGYTASTITLELLNHSTKEFAIYPGMRIAQIVFQILDQPCEKSYQETGRYNNQLAVREAILND